MTAHLDKWASDIVRILPDPAWSGVANLVTPFNPHPQSTQNTQTNTFGSARSQSPEWMVDKTRIEAARK